MYDTVVLATDGSQSGERAVTLALDFVRRFDADVHTLFVTDTSELDATPSQVRDDLEDALNQRGQEALDSVEERADREVITAIREGKPATEICSYAQEVEADMIVTGTRGRNGEHAYLLGSVAEAVVRQSPVPVLTVRQLDGADQPDQAVATIGEEQP